MHLLELESRTISRPIVVTIIVTQKIAQDEETNTIMRILKIPFIEFSILNIDYLITKPKKKHFLTAFDSCIAEIKRKDYAFL